MINTIFRHPRLCNKRLALAFVVLGLSLVATSSFAATKYVSDVLYITLRTGQSEEFRILRSLKSGTPLEILQETDGEYALVRTEDGVEGYVQHRFLVGEPIAADLLAKAQEELSRVSKENEQLKQRLNTAREELKDTEKERKRLESENQQLANKQDKLQAIAAKPMELDEQNRELRTRNAELQKELDDVKREYASVANNTQRDWFLAGAGVIVLGIIIGLVVPRLRMRKQSSWA